MFNQEPTETLKKAIDEVLLQPNEPGEAQLIHIVFLGREIFFHPQFADMTYVESKNHISQLDAERRETFESVRSWVRVGRASRRDPKEAEKAEPIWEGVARVIFDIVTGEFYNR
jgi:hypothetical protein